MTANVARGVLEPRHRHVGRRRGARCQPGRRYDRARRRRCRHGRGLGPARRLRAARRPDRRHGPDPRPASRAVRRRAGQRLGRCGGGTVLVGGNRQGQGPERNAQATYVDANATINADATRSGNGGTVVVWSDQYTNFRRHDLGARRPPGRQWRRGRDLLARRAHRDRSGECFGARRQVGPVAARPTDVTITNTNTNDPNSAGTFDPTGVPAQIDAATISAALSGGNRRHDRYGSVQRPAGATSPCRRDNQHQR